MEYTTGRGLGIACNTLRMLVLYTGNYCKINLDKFCIFSKFEQNDRRYPFKHMVTDRYFVNALNILFENGQ
jgi:hypothetical protein